jgi:hypothetical protein
MVSYPIHLYTNLVARVANPPPPGPRHKVLVAPFAFDRNATNEFAAVIDGYRRNGYGLGLWQTVDDALEDTADFEPDTRPTRVMEQLVAAVDTGDAVPDDLPEYLLISNANFFDFTEETLRGWNTASKVFHHASIHLALYHRVRGQWRLVTVAQEDNVNVDPLSATNTGVRAAVEKLLDRWRARPSGESP